jgi:spore maturation protein CgeB
VRICVINPGASTSTIDVYNGLVAGLEANGHEVVKYNLDTRIARAGQFLHFIRNKAVKAGKNIPKPNIADILYQAGCDAIPRILHFNPDWTIVVSGMYYPKYFLKLLQNASLQVGLLLTESPYDDEEQEKLASHVTVVWTNERTSVERLRIANPNTFYMPHAYDPARHSPEQTEVDVSVPSHDVVFVGTCFQERIELLSSVDWTGIDLGLYGSWDELGSRSKLRKYVRGEETSNLLTAALYRKAKVGLNLYRQSKGFGRNAPRIESAESLNPRAYELAACGAFHISDYRAEVVEIFGGDLVPTFTDAESLERKVRHWIADDAGRELIAKKLPDAVKDNDWHSRARRVVTDLQRINSTSAVNTMATMAATV